MSNVATKSKAQPKKLTKAQADFERASRAVRAFYRMQPNLEAFARVFTRDKRMTIAPTATTSMTDGKRIYLRVNIELGDEHRHDRDVCQKRDARDQLMCRACLVRENMLVALFHEIAHVAYDSFEPMSNYEKEKAVEEAVLEAGRFGLSGKRLEAIRRSMIERPPATYGEASARISPYLQPLINGLEDARINVKTIEARKGMKSMFEARTRRIFEEGIETEDGSRVHWRDQPENAQIAVALSQYAQGTYESNWFSEPVAEAMRDPELQSLAKAAVSSGSAAEVYRLGFPLLEKLRKLGFCKVEGEPEDEPEPLESDEGEPDAEDTGGDHDEETDDPEPGEDPDESNEPQSGDTVENDDAPDTDEVDPDSEPEQEPSQEEQEQSGADGEASDEDDADTGDEDEGDEADSDDEHGDGADGEGDGESDTDESDDDDGALGDPERADDGEQDPDPQDDGSGPDEAPDDALGADDDDDTDDQDPDQAGTGSKPDDDEGDEPEETADDFDYGDESADKQYNESDDEVDVESEGDDEPEPDRGTPDDVTAAMNALCSHKPHHHHDDENDDDDPDDFEDEDDRDQPLDDDEASVDRAIVQERDFDEPSMEVYESKVYEFGDAMNMNRVRRNSYKYGVVEMGERVIQQSLGKMRVAFSENRKGAKERNLKSGKVNGKVLGRRVPVEDPRLFQKRRRPGKRDYFVVIGVDVSMSTNSGQRIQNIKSAALAQAELLSRVGVPFEVWAHTCNTNHKPAEHASYGVWLETQLYKIKTVDQRWNTETRTKLESLVPSAANLDGHTMEFYRKRLDRSDATDKVLMYYTDGDMPYENYEEELRILKRELRECERRGYTVVGVGFQTDSPTQHGLPTVRIDSIEDVPKVVDELRKRLA